MKANDIIKIAAIKNQDSIMKKTLSTDEFEKGFFYGRDTNGVYKTSSIYAGTSGNVPMPYNYTGLDFIPEGLKHNHPNTGYEVMSVGDIYDFSKRYKIDKRFTHHFANGHLGSEYLYTVADLFSLEQFESLYPVNDYKDPDYGDWNESTDIGKDAKQVFDYFNVILNKTDEESMAMAMAFVIAKYKLGVGLSKKNPATGKFEPIFVKEVPDTSDPSKKIYEKTTDCNL